MLKEGEAMIREGDVQDQQSIEALFAAHGDSVYRFALHSIGNPEDARDVVQEVFIRVQGARHAFRGESKIRTWLFQIAKNYITDCLRKKRDREVVMRETHVASVLSQGNLDIRIDLERAVTRLKLEYRQVIALRFIEDLSVDETARILRWTSGNVRTTQYRALQHLRDILSESQDDETEGKMKG